MDRVVYLRDLDGTGSLHVCSKGDPGAIAHVPATAAPIRVKPLVWSDGRVAMSTFGKYRIVDLGWYWEGKPDRFDLSLNGADVSAHPDADAAKAAAQADYEARILAALEPAPDMAELVEAHRENARVLSHLHNDLQGRVDAAKLAALFECLARSTAALAKIKEPQT